MHNASKFAANMDDYLMRLGFCRKPIVRDSSCLFRIISEQIYFTQALHISVQKKCLEYLCSHRDELINEIPVHCEMVALSKLFKLDIIVFQCPDEKPVNITRNGYSKMVLLCHVDGLHFDIVYPQSHIHGLAICQSIIYEVLYRGVFKLNHELDDAVNFLRQQKKNSRENSLTDSDPVNISTLSCSPTDSSYDLSQKIALRLTPPLPYRIAKALDPTLFRNVARDIVEEEKREAKLRYQNCGFTPGDKCQVVLSSQPSKAYNAFIQELSENQGPVVVFLEELGEKRTVPYISLRHFPASRNGCQYSLSETGYIPYIDRKIKKKKSGIPIPSDVNCYQSSRRHSPRNWVQSSIKTMQLPSQPVEYNTANIDVSTPYCPVTINGGPPIISNSSMPVANPPTYFMPVVNVPYPPNLGQVNFNSGPSQDPYGKDLPQDVNTLRYFYNFGVESCRMMSTVMQQQTMAYPPALMSAESQGHLIYSGPVEHGQFAFSSGDHNKTYSIQTNMKSSNHSFKPNVTMGVKANNINSGYSDKVKDVKCQVKDMETDMLANDNSELVSPHKLDSPGSDSGLDSTTSSMEESVTCSVDTQDHVKVKGKRKYYMYGNLKLVKPIKDIPPRFQMLLAETSAAKARCEGQPIYIQTNPEPQYLDHDMELNANAQCFIPMQAMPTTIPSSTSSHISGVGIPNVHNNHPAITFPNACYPPPAYVMGSGPPSKVNNLPKASLASQPHPANPPAANLINPSGGGTCYYVYSSTSSGYSTLPPVTPAVPPNNQAQVIYMMNAPYAPPPCPTYPALQPVPGYGMCSAAAQ